MNPRLQLLQPYPFARLSALIADLHPPAHLPPIHMHIGEPRHPAPEFVEKLLADSTGLNSYPSSYGTPELRQSCAQALRRRYQLPVEMLDADNMIVPVNGTREALFSFVQAVIGRKRKPLVVMPNPFYQIYEGAALLAGAQPWFLNGSADNGFVPDLEAVPEAVWARCELLLLCSPGNPTGACANRSQLRTALRLADTYDFVVASDECYADIYREHHPPPGLLQVCHEDQRDDLTRCAVFHSLSKRSNVPGLRSGFVAASPDIVTQYRQYRTYHGATMAPPIARASAALWEDDETPAWNRRLYDRKYREFITLLAPHWPLQQPAGGFYLWAKTPYDDIRFSRDLYAQQNLTVLPGSYLARDAHGINPGSGWVRISLVASTADCETAARRIVSFFQTHD